MSLVIPGPTLFDESSPLAGNGIRSRLGYRIPRDPESSWSDCWGTHTRARTIMNLSVDEPQSILLQIDDDAMTMFAQTRSVLSNLRHALHQPHCVPGKFVWCCKDLAAAAL